MRLIYILLAYLLAPVYCAVLLARSLRERRYWRDFSQRFGCGKTLPERSLWVHAASVGEVQAAAALIRALQQRHPQISTVVTTLTPTGRERARALFSDHTEVRYVPIDLPGAVRRFFDRVRPRVAVIFETELWPNLYHECGRRRVPLVLASARISTRSVRRYRRLPGLLKQTLANGVTIGAQGAGDAERFRALGADPARTHVTGNIKFDLHLPPDLVARGQALRQAFGIEQRPVWIAGSTHDGEEAILLEAQRLLRRSHANALWILAPRHPNRFTDVAAWLKRERVHCVRRSQDRVCETVTEVLLVDTLGELLEFYAAADVAFVGGSLVNVGGHNLLEPAALGLPVLTGPHNFNSEDVARLLIAAGAAEIVHDAAELAQKLAALLASPTDRARMGAAGRATVQANRGALDNLLALIEPLLREQAQGSSPEAPPAPF